MLFNHKSLRFVKPCHIWGLMYLMGFEYRYRPAKLSRPSHMSAVILWMLLSFRLREVKLVPCHISLLKWEISFPPRLTNFRSGISEKVPGWISGILPSFRWRKTRDVRPTNWSALMSLSSVEDKSNSCKLLRSEKEPDSMEVIGFMASLRYNREGIPANIPEPMVDSSFPDRERVSKDTSCEKVLAAIRLILLELKFKILREIKPCHMSRVTSVSWLVCRVREAHVRRWEKSPGWMLVMSLELRSTNVACWGMSPGTSVRWALLLT